MQEICTRRFQGIVRQSNPIRPVQTNCPVDNFFHILLCIKKHPLKGFMILMQTSDCPKNVWNSSLLDTYLYSGGSGSFLFQRLSHSPPGISAARLLMH